MKKSNKKNKKKLKQTEYQLEVHFVDSTYWDDGSRWTSRTFIYQTEKEALDAKKDMLAKGMKFTSPVSYKTVIEYLQEDDIKINKITKEEL